MSQELRLGAVFVPGKFPQHTYNPRSYLNLESVLEDYLDEGGTILTVAGPTKTGKSVLVRKVVTHNVWVDGHGLESVSDLWARIGDALGTFTDVQVADGVGTEQSISVSTGINLQVANIGVDTQSSDSSNTDRSFGVRRPIANVARDALINSGKSLVIDDFHFVKRDVQREIVRALKPLVFAGVPVIIISISHRVRDVFIAEPDMRGRVEDLSVKYWDNSDLLVIANKGFQILNVGDPEMKLASVLAMNSYGSPHLMQRFCRELCKGNNVRSAGDAFVQLQAPDDWSGFFERQADKSSEDWFKRLLRGPQERGTERVQWNVGNGRKLDTYGLALLALADLGPRHEMGKDEIKRAVDNIVVGAGPQAHQVTRVLQFMSRIAATRVSEEALTEPELEASNDDGSADVQPVLEYVEDGPNSVLHIADPFFAFYLKWMARKELLGTDK